MKFWLPFRRFLRAQGGYLTIGPVDPRDKGTRRCPQGCDPPMIMKGLPPPRDQEHNGFARCLRCLTYWEVTPQGIIVNMRRPLEALTVQGPPLTLGGKMEPGSEKEE